MKKLLAFTLSFALGSTALQADVLGALFRGKQYVKEATATQVPTVEFWNKSGTTVYFAITPEPGTEQQIRVLGPGERFRGMHDQSFSKYSVYLTSTTKAQRSYDMRLFELRMLKQTTTLYVRLSEDADIFGPQRGPLRGLKQVTESNLSLRHNVKSKQVFEHFGPKHTTWFSQKVGAAIAKREQ